MTRVHIIVFVRTLTAIHGTLVVLYLHVCASWFENSPVLSVSIFRHDSVGNHSVPDKKEKITNIIIIANKQTSSEI